MRKTRIATLFAASIFTYSAYADFVGLNIGSSFWIPNTTGTFNSSSSSNDISVNNDLDVDDQSNYSFNISFEHPIPTLPNIRFQNVGLNSTGTSNVGSINFDNKSFTGNVTSTFDISHNDFVLYYELLDNWVNLDVGVNLKLFEGEISLADGSSDGRININETIPILYLAARFDLPFTGFYVGANIQNISLVDSSVEDSSLMIGYETGDGVGVEGGYKTFSLNLDDARNLNTNFEYDGIYLNGYIHF